MKKPAAPLEIALAPEHYFATVKPDATEPARTTSPPPGNAPKPPPRIATASRSPEAPVGDVWQRLLHKQDTDQSPLRLLPSLMEPETLRKRVLFLIVAAAIALGFLWMNLCFWAPAHPGVDQNGYLVGGRMLADHGSTGYRVPEPYAFVGAMWVGVRFGTPAVEYFPKYPIGLPAIYAACLKLGPAYASVRTQLMDWRVLHSIPLWVGRPNGTTLAYLVSPICTTLAIWAMFLLGRFVAGSFGGVMAMILLATSQVTLALANNPNSHASALFCVTWGVYFLVRWWQSGWLWRGILGGFLLGYAVTIRYTEGLLLLPMAVTLVSIIRLTPWTAVGWWRPTLWLIAGAAGIAARWVFGKPIHLPIATAVAVVVFLITFRWSEWLRSLLAAGLLAAVLTIEWPTTPLDNAVAWTKYGTAKAGLLIAMALLFSIPWRRPRSWLPSLAVAIAWGLPVGHLVLFNLRFIGAITGYDPTNESDGFSWLEFQNKWEFMSQQIYDHSIFFITPLAVLGMAMMYRTNRRLALFVTAWFVPGVLLYTAYYWGGGLLGVAYLRFFLTLFPAIILAAVWLIHAAARGADSEAIVLPGRSAAGSIATPIAAGLIVAIASVIGLRVALPGMEREAAGNLNLAYSGFRVLSKIEPNISQPNISQETGGHARPVLFLDQRSNRYQLANYLQFAGDVEVYAGDAFNPPMSFNVNGNADQPAPLQPARRKYLLDVVFKGKTDADLVREQHRIIQSALDARRPVYAVLQPNWVPVFTKQYMIDGFEATVIDRWREPAAMPPEQSNGALGPGARGFVFSPSRAPQAYQVLRITRREAAAAAPASGPTTGP